MLFLIIFSFIAGIVTILSPCILPVLPIILSSTVDSKGINRKKPFGVIIGFILGFTFFTLGLSYLVKLTALSSDFLRSAAVVVIAVFGVTLLVPSIQKAMELLFSKLTRFSPKTTNKEGFRGGVLIGLSLGLLWTPCVGPILASVISLAAIGEVNFSSILITFSYSVGTALPMLLIMLGGQRVLKKVSWFSQNAWRVQQVFGLLMILTALAVATNLDRKFQIYILDTFPQYGLGLTKIEENKSVTNALENFREKEKIEVFDISTKDLIDKRFKAPELIPGGHWFNTAELKLADLRGKVVLIDFWTYTCINCQRTLPYLQTWWERYEGDGFVIIGVHSPEFEFEKDPKNLQGAINDFGLTYPIVQDNDFATWQAYVNRYWPAKYLVDKDGYVRYTHFGEGAYDETEVQIGKLLEEAGADAVSSNVSNPTYQVHSNTPETYLGYERIRNFASPEKISPEKLSTYTLPAVLPANNVAFVGEWLISGEYSSPKAGGELHLNFDAQKVFLVMNPKETKGLVKVYLDGEFLREVAVTADSLYTLVDLPEPGKHVLKLEFIDDNIEVFAFTFG
jgi:cytochrome c biogenesis protein CcdA/thiol-disulfide isomerase/thioredoxin